MAISDVEGRYILVLLLAALPIPAGAQAIASTPLSAPELGALRGGFDLPGGGTVALGVVTETRINGQEVLRTVFNVQAGPPVVTIFARNSGSAETLTPVNAAVGAPGVATVDGAVSVAAQPRGVRVDFIGDRIDVSHLIGSSIGSVIINSADNRAIDVATTVNISLGGVARDTIGASSARVDTLALDSTMRLSR